MEVRRGRYNKSYEHPQPLVANQPTDFAIPLRSHDHVFLKGHRIMVQVQSTWFPVIDRNPQKFVPSIYKRRRRTSSARRSASTRRASTVARRAAGRPLEVCSLKSEVGSLKSEA
jgi:predicted acyl esterase